jgi:hypothetical protein
MMNKVELEVTLSNGNTTLIAVKGVQESVLQGGKIKKITAPTLDGFDLNKPYLLDSNETSLHIQDLFEVVHYCFVEGEMTSGDIEGDDEVGVLATYQFLINGNPSNFSEVEASLGNPN